MKRLVSTLNLSKEEWLRYRKCGITGTDAGCILGLNPYRSAFQVYHDKINDTIENIDNEAMRQGLSLIHISEPTRRTIPSRMPSSA